MCKRLEVGKIYNAFDDGKIKPSRLIKWQIIEELDLEKDRVNNLHKDSIVKTDVIYRILNEQILFKIGKVDSEKIEEYKKSFYDTLKENNQ